MMAAGRGPALGVAPDSLLQLCPLVVPNCSLSSGLHIIALAASSNLFFLDKLCLSVPSPSSVVHLLRTSPTNPKTDLDYVLPLLSLHHLSTQQAETPGRTKSWLPSSVWPLRTQPRHPRAGRKKEQLTHCHWRFPSLALSPGTGLGKPALPGPGRAVAGVAGPGSALVHLMSTSADLALCPRAASALPLSGVAKDRLVTKVGLQASHSPSSALSPLSPTSQGGGRHESLT